ncbi:MAG TPA: hypothetical protein PKW55_00905 [Spirochaetota bacterium]|nr:hypothetical protein [Spirochaetota bacterium]HOM39209.1 hypothetical protein [Spirochaetota bacterium]HPQ49244.1 hypothetical protein [Spirochaetota bacterium]
MKKIAIIFLSILFMSVSYATKTSEKKIKKDKIEYRLPSALQKEIQNWSKEKLEYLSNVYLELGKRFYEIERKNDSMACYMYSIQVYPIGTPSTKAKELLKQQHNIIIP